MRFYGNLRFSLFKMWGSFGGVDAHGNGHLRGPAISRQTLYGSVRLSSRRLPAVATANMTNPSFDVVVGADSERRWNSIRERQAARDKLSAREKRRTRPPGYGRREKPTTGLYREPSSLPSSSRSRPRKSFRFGTQMGQEIDFQGPLASKLIPTRLGIVCSVALWS